MLRGGDLGHDPSALSSLRRGGYYAYSPVPGLRVISLNINYWVVQNTVRAVSMLCLSMYSFHHSFRHLFTAQRQRQKVDASNVPVTGRFGRQEAGAAGSSAAAEGGIMMAWLNTQLAAAESKGDAVHILGHQPPTDSAWLPGWWGQCKPEPRFPTLI